MPCKEKPAMTRLGNEIEEELKNIRTEWPQLNNKTKQKLPAYLSYDYFKSNSNDLDQLVTEHESLSSRASNAKANLNRQVDSSGNHVAIIEKYGLRTVALVAVLCAVIGVGIGRSVPAWWPIAAVIGAVVGFFGCGVAALLLYFLLRWRARGKRDEWDRVLQRNEEGMALSSVIGEKRREVKRIKETLHGMQEDNLADEDRFLKECIANY